MTASVKEAVLQPDRCTIAPANTLLRDNPSPTAVAIAPCVVLNRPQLLVRSDTTSIDSTSKSRFQNLNSVGGRAFVEESYHFLKMENIALTLKTKLIR